MKISFLVKSVFFVLSGFLVFYVFTHASSSFFSLSYTNTEAYIVKNTATVVQSEIDTNTFVATHVDTPTQVKAIYMTSWVASVPSLRAGLVKIIDDTEINSVVIDVKDYAGTISFEVKNKELKAFGSEDIRVNDMPEFLAELHAKGIYTIARVAVFQDAYMVKAHPEWAVKNLSGTAVWKDRKGISWIDVGARDYWKYITLVAQEAHNAGFDEINFDYIRFPSDGNMKDISFPFTQKDSKSGTLKNFFAYLHDAVAPSGMKTSADLFGMTTTITDDMGIGQVLENALPYFDYIAPMVYPSHYPTTFQGYKNPADHPYEVIHYAMGEGVKRAKAASTSPLKLRPWLQDFDLGADYGPTEVRKQIQATYDVGLDSWMLWSASNKYTVGALEGDI
jgi:hypothetical protein